MRFPQTFIDDLRRQADIVRIVQEFVTLDGLASGPEGETDRGATLLRYKPS